MSAHRKLLLPCSCIGCCAVLGVDDWGDMDEHPDDPLAWTFELYTRAGSGPATLGWRLKTALNMLLGRDYHLDCVALDGPGMLKLRAFLSGEDDG